MTAEVLRQTAGMLRAQGHSALAVKFDTAASMPPHHVSLTDAEREVLRGLTLPGGLSAAIGGLSSS